MTDHINPVFQKILDNIERGYKDGMEKVQTTRVEKELAELEDKIGETIEYLTKMVTQGEVDLPVICMIHLMDAGDAVRKAIKEYEAHKQTNGSASLINAQKKEDV